MRRDDATRFLRDTLDSHLLNDWRIKVVTNVPFLGKCRESDKTIYLNGLAIDTHPDVEVKDIILHEVAHAIVGCRQAHNQVWRAKAVELGCTGNICGPAIDEKVLEAMRSGDTVEVTFEKVIEKTVIENEVIKPKYNIKRLQEECPVCGKVAKEKHHFTTTIVLEDYQCANNHKWTDTVVPVITNKSAPLKRGRKAKPIQRAIKCPTCNSLATKRSNEREVDRKFITLECMHLIVKDIPCATPFHKFISADADPNCEHEWNYTKCFHCNAKKLYPFQIEGARFLEVATALNRGGALFDEMGLGKTIQPLAFFKYHSEKLPCLWVTKSGSKFPHAKEIVDWLGYDYLPMIIHTSKDMLLPGCKFYVCSYDIFRKFDLNKFKEAGIKTMVLDECQQIKNPDAARTGGVRTVAKMVETVIPTSGTPWKNRGTELYVALNMLDSRRFYSLESFKRNWVDYYWEGNKEKEGGIVNPEKFREYIKDIVIRRERKVVMPELPLINRTKQLVRVPEQYRESYNAALDNLVDKFNTAILEGTENSFAMAGQTMVYLNQMNHIIGLAKVPQTIEYVKEFLEETIDEKIVVFVENIDVGTAIELAITEYKNSKDRESDNFEILRLEGGMASQKRYEIQNAFNTTKKCVLIASTKSSGEGLNLQSGFRCIMHQRQWNPANEEQAEGRFIRIGQQSETVDAIYMHGDDSVDTKFDKIVERKRAQFHKVMNTGDAPQWIEKDVIMELVSELVNDRMREKKLRKSA
jgi:hypothetical protein